MSASSISEHFHILTWIPNYTYLFSTSKDYLYYIVLQVIFPKDYEKDLAPKHTVNGQRVDTALPVYLSVDILSFDKIDTVNMMIG